MGFAEQLRAILGAMSDSRQTLLFSATLPAALAEFARAGLRDPELVRLDVESKLSPDLGLAFFTARSDFHSSWQALSCVDLVFAAPACSCEHVRPSLSISVMEHARQ